MVKDRLYTRLREYQWRHILTPMPVRWSNNLAAGGTMAWSAEYAVEVGDLQPVRISPGQSVARPEATRVCLTRTDRRSIARGRRVRSAARLREGLRLRQKPVGRAMLRARSPDVYSEESYANDSVLSEKRLGNEVARGSGLMSMPPRFGQPDTFGNLLAGLLMAPKTRSKKRRGTKRCTGSVRPGELPTENHLPLDPRIGLIANEIVSRAILPPKAALDALHIAAVARHGIEYLLTWNCRHIASARILPRIRDVLTDVGIPHPIICTPAEMVDMEPKYEHDSECDCSFLGHWYGHDVYSYEDGGKGIGILCRFGDRPADYASQPVAAFADCMVDADRLIGLPDDRTMPFQDWALSGESGRCQKAFVVGAIALLRRMLGEQERAAPEEPCGCMDNRCKKCAERPCPWADTW